MTIINEIVNETEKKFGASIMALPAGLQLVTFTNFPAKYIVWQTMGNLQYAHLILCLKELYTMEGYGRYDVAGLTVVDVGAYLGETAIMFLQKGAKEVVCYEPYASGALIAANCRLNGFHSGFKVYRNPVVGEHRIVEIDRNMINFGGSRLEASGKIGEIGLSLEDIAIQDAVLKMDCEGAEHAVFENASRETIRKFRYIMMECHETYDDIVTRLAECGFYVESPRQEWSGVWLIDAKRID